VTGPRPKGSSVVDRTTLSTRIASVPLWYHTIDLPAGLTTPGWFDLRSVVDRLPWPDVKGKRCLDIGTFDGFLAFEMERRGASEVVCTDVRSHEDWDHLPRERAQVLAYWAAAGGEKGAGFRIAAEILGSSVTREWISIYDLSPERLGTFDVVVCGNLLVHLRAPFVALDAVRSVCGDRFLSTEPIDRTLTFVSRKRAALSVEGREARWMIPNVAAHRRMIDVAGFDLLATTTYAERFGVGHPERARRGSRHRSRRILNRLLTGDSDVVPHSAVLSRIAQLD